MESRAKLRSTLVLLISALWLFLPVGVRSQSSDLVLVKSVEAELDSLAAQVAKRVRLAYPEKDLPKILVVDFFRNSAGGSSKLGTLLADRFSETLGAYSTEMKILDRKLLKDYLIQEWTTLEDFSNALSCALVGRQIGATAVLVGILYEDNGYIKLTVHLEGFGTASKMEDPFRVTDDNIRFASSDELHSALYQRGPNYARTADKIPEEPGIFRAGVNGVTSPQCIYCPQPEYSDAARASKYSGTVLSSIVVSAEGVSSAPYVLKGAAFGLTGKSLMQIKNWKFIPAQKDGKPVASRVEIEITFHPY